MVKGKSLLEKIWWVIPPVVVVFGIPLHHTFREMIRSSQPINSFVSIYMKNMLYSLIYYFFDFWGVIVTLSTIAFMGIGYYLSRRKSLLIRLLIPIFAAIMGYYISSIITFMLTVY